MAGMAALSAANVFAEMPGLQLSRTHFDDEAERLKTDAQSMAMMARPPAAMPMVRPRISRYVFTVANCDT